ncbi:hypothetical protein FQR65_LT01775 [Abscondita terminalis]|nr:hypothetical protein FQR65_LT01775 [Abscondita terminalis]
MNYEGLVTSVNPVTMTFEVDYKVTVHTGHYAISTDKMQLPELGEQVKIYHAHFLITSNNKLSKLFVCDRGKIVCDDYTITDDTTFIELIDDYNLGCSDLEAIDINIPVINERIKPLTSNTSLDVMLEIVRNIADMDESKNKHKCLNHMFSPLRIKTVSDYCFVDLHPNRQEKMPAWFIGSHSKDGNDKLLGFLQINKRFGILLLQDSKGATPCVVVNCNKANLSNFINKFIIVSHYRIFTETYREKDVPTSQYILFDLNDAFALHSIYHNRIAGMQQYVVETLPDNYSYAFKFAFKLLRKATVNVNSFSQIECWLEVLLSDTMQHIYLGLSAYQVQVMPVLNEGCEYEVYHSNRLLDCVNNELVRIKSLPTKKFQEKTTTFVRILEKSSNPVLSVAEVVRNSVTDLISVRGVVALKKLTPALSSRTKIYSSMPEFGTPDSDDGVGVYLYLNNWENLQMPLGLIPGMEVCAKNVVLHRNYLKSTALTSLEIVSYNPPVFFDTVNMCLSLERACDKYSYLGWGNLIPSNVLVWARVSILYVRSLRISFTCICSKSECDCSICITLTFYVQDEFGSALVLCKNLEVLRLILELESEQWKVWCQVFKTVKEYRYSEYDEVSSESVFIEALKTSIETINTCTMSNLEFKCRKIDSSSHDDNSRIPLWFCIDARTKGWGL